MQKYVDKISETLAPFNHHYVVLGHKIQTLEGEPPKGGIVIIAFDSSEKARESYDSPAYDAIKPIRRSEPRAAYSSSKARPLVTDRSSGYSDDFSRPSGSPWSQARIPRRKG